MNWLERYGANGWRWHHYQWFRRLCGAYLLVHFLQLLPWAAETFSNQGALPQAESSPLFLPYFNILAVNDSATAVVALVAVAAMLSLRFAMGRADAVAAVGLWYVLACLVGRNPLTLNPSLPFVGWILLAHTQMPARPNSAEEEANWRFPSAIFAAAWILMAAAYSFSGYTKMVSPSWLDGSAMTHVLENPLARPTFVRQWLVELPGFVLSAATWGALLAELLFLPLALSRRLRPLLWLGMVAMHLGLLVLIDFADLTLGMLVLHAFTFDPAWLQLSATAADHAALEQLHGD